MSGPFAQKGGKLPGVTFMPKAPAWAHWDPAAKGTDLYRSSLGALQVGLQLSQTAQIRMLNTVLPAVLKTVSDLFLVPIPQGGPGGGSGRQDFFKNRRCWGRFGQNTAGNLFVFQWPQAQLGFLDVTV